MGVSPAGRPAGHGEPTPVWTSSERGLRALRSVLQAHARGRSAEGDLRRAIAVVCHEAHRRRLRAEHVIITVKQTWHSLPEVRELSSGSDRGALLDRVIRLTIDEFYAERG